MMYEEWVYSMCEVLRRLYRRTLLPYENRMKKCSLLPVDPAPVPGPRNKVHKKDRRPDGKNFLIRKEMQSNNFCEDLLALPLRGSPALASKRRQPPSERVEIEANI